MTYSAYLFDLDGTLIDSVGLILESFHHTRHVHFGDRLPDALYLRTLGTPLRDVFRSMTGDLRQVDDLIRTYVDYNLARHDEAVRSYAGIPEAVSVLAQRGARLAVVTSKLRDTALRGLAVCGLTDAFELVIAADDVERGKPDPEPVLRALDELSVAPERAVLVGDSPHDLIAGRRAGVDTAAAAWGPFERDVLRREEPTHWLEAPADLSALLI